MGVKQEISFRASPAGGLSPVERSDAVATIGDCYGARLLFQGIDGQAEYEYLLSR